MPKRIERLRWSIATVLDKLPGQCWAVLVDWALGTRRWPLSSQTDSCWADAARVGACYCGKIRATEGGRSWEPTDAPGGATSRGPAAGGSEARRA